MKAILTISSVLLFLSSAPIVAQGTIQESLIFESKVLGKRVAYSVYLPASYTSSNRSYPVLYLLHGYTDDETGWTQFGEVKNIADGLAGHPAYTEMIILMPDAGLDWYINSFDGQVNYEDFFIKEFIPGMEKEYRVRSKKEFRAVSGLSMGGHGTFIYALKYPELFAVAAPLSAVAWTPEDLQKEQQEWEQYFAYAFGPAFNEDSTVREHIRNNFAHYLIQSRPTEALRSVKWYIDCGDEDELLFGNAYIHKLMTDRQIGHEFRVRDGKHNWTYWREALPEVLMFASKSFHR